MFNTKQEHAISFTGNASEYFSIWIVNLFLSIITLGIYSAWAKVRRKKYFYNNMKIDGVGFDYHAKPISILKGRIIAFTLFLVYSLSHQSMPIVSGACALIFFIALPWIIVRANIFNSRNTSHRGLRFNFNGSVQEARRVFFWLAMIVPFTMGLLYPYVAQQRSIFLMNHHQFGQTSFSMNVESAPFYKIYLKAIGIGILAMILFGIGIALLVAAITIGHAGLPESRSVAITVGIFLYISGLLSLVGYLQARFGNLVWNNTTIDNISFASSLRARDMIGLYLTNMLVIMLSFGLMTPWAHIRMLKYRASRLVLLGDVDFDHFVANKKEELKATGEEIADMFDVDLAFG